MIPARIIASKRDHRELTHDEIEFFVRGFSSGRIPDYQMSAMAMAVFLNGMTDAETMSLTHCMLNSGTQLQWPPDGVPRVDKHSTGGVGDKVSLPLAPLLAACGLQVPMLSGRGLGPTGGTLDKLESIDGFRTNLSLSQITSQTQKIGCVITGATTELAPADQKLYALRDVTATVPSIPLITASIMSKKLAESLDALTLDVKFGSGAFMKTREQAAVLAGSLVRTGRNMGVSTTALLTDMNQPLGNMCGNAVEVIEAIDILQGHGPADVRALTLRLAAELLVSSGMSKSLREAESTATKLLVNGTAYEKWQQMLAAQGATSEARPAVARAHDIMAVESGCVRSIDTESIGMEIIAMGGGRKQMGDRIDHSVGVEMLVRIGDRVNRGDVLARIFVPEAPPHMEAIRSAIQLGESTEPRCLIADIITQSPAQENS